MANSDDSETTPGKLIPSEEEDQEWSGSVGHLFCLGLFFRPVECESHLGLFNAIVIPIYSFKQIITSVK